MRLLDFLHNRYARDRDLTPGAVRKYDYSCRRFSEFLAKPADLEDLTTENLSLFTAARQAEVCARSARNDCDNVCRLAKIAVEEGLIKPLGKVRRPKVPPKIPVAWTVEELVRLRNAAGAMTKPLYWRTLIDATYDAALRKEDMLNFDMQSLRPDGSADVVQRKTQSIHTVKFRPETLAAMRELGGRYPLHWPKSGQKEFYGHWKKLRTMAGLTSGGMQQLRRTSATFTAKVQPGMASRLLGHRTPGLAEKSYIDPRIAGEHAVEPPDDWRKEADAKPEGQAGDQADDRREGDHDAA